MSLDFSPAALAASFLVSAVGFVFYKYGRSMRRTPQIVGGIVLMVFPYFITDPLITVLIGGLISGLIWFLTRRGF